jgi:hypothetical protein
VTAPFELEKVNFVIGLRQGGEEAMIVRGVVAGEIKNLHNKILPNC